MRHFEPVLTTVHAPRQTRQYSTTVEVEQTVTVIPRLSQARAFAGKPEADWDWSDLRDYVVTSIEQRFGAFPRDAKKEAGIFKSFISRHGAQAVAIARFAFEVESGYWAGAPISVNRFCKGSDPYFSEVIKQRLVTETVEGW